MCCFGWWQTTFLWYWIYCVCLCGTTWEAAWSRYGDRLITKSLLVWFLTVWLVCRVGELWGIESIACKHCWIYHILLSSNCTGVTAMRKQLQYFKYASFFTETAENKLGIDRDPEGTSGFTQLIYTLFQKKVVQFSTVSSHMLMKICFCSPNRW